MCIRNQMKFEHCMKTEAVQGDVRGNMLRMRHVFLWHRLPPDQTYFLYVVLTHLSRLPSSPGFDFRFLSMKHYPTFWLAIRQRYHWVLSMQIEYVACAFFHGFWNFLFASASFSTFSFFSLPSLSPSQLFPFHLSFYLTHFSIFRHANQSLSNSRAPLLTYPS